jgi:hypothetical protein
MILEKDGKTIELKDESFISGFKNGGWEEVSLPPKTTPKTEAKKK